MSLGGNGLDDSIRLSAVTNSESRQNIIRHLDLRSGTISWPSSFSFLKDFACIILADIIYILINE
jgi:hypothetical protein